MQGARKALDEIRVQVCICISFVCPECFSLQVTMLPYHRVGFLKSLKSALHFANASAMVITTAITGVTVWANFELAADLPPTTRVQFQFELQPSHYHQVSAHGREVEPFFGPLQLQLSLDQCLSVQQAHHHLLPRGLPSIEVAARPPLPSTRRCNAVFSKVLVAQHRD